MSIIKLVKDYIRKKGFFFSVTRQWPGDEQLGQAMPKDKVITKEEVNAEIQESLHKKER